MQFLLGFLLGIVIMVPGFVMMVRLQKQAEAEADHWCEVSCEETTRLLHYMRTGELLGVEDETATKDCLQAGKHEATGEGPEGPVFIESKH